MATFRYKTGITSLTLSIISFPTTLFCVFEFLWLPFVGFVLLLCLLLLVFFQFSEVTLSGHNKQIVLLL